jgi:hypothetical protein
MDEHQDDGVDAFLSNLTGEDPKKPSTKKVEEAPEEQEETPVSEEDTQTADEKTEDTEDTEGEEGETDPDDAEVEIKVGEETKKATIKELKRLYGQEAALTQKSQALAAARTAADQKFSQADTALTAMVERAKTAYEPYANLDFMVLAQRMDTETFQALRQDAAQAESNLKFFEAELTGLQQTQAQHTAQAHREAATACIAELNDPEKGIKGWGEPLYNELMAFGAKHIGPTVRQMTNPAAIKTLHMAMQWAKSQDALKTAAAKVQAAPNKPTVVLKPGASKTQGGRQATAMQALRRSGSTDDATDAFLASFK